MNCLQAEEHFSAHYEDTLDYQMLRRFESHIDECEGCEREYILFRESVQASQQLPQIEPSPTFTATLQQRLSGEQRGTLSFLQRLRQLFILPKWAYGLAIILAFTSSVSFLYYDDIFNGRPQSEINSEYISTESSNSQTQFPMEIDDRFLPRSFGSINSTFSTSSRPMQRNYVLKRVSYTTTSTAGGL